jgi:hypothetical protein
MRARSIKPGICDNEVLGTADPFCTLLFERLWMMADREGRLEDRPLRIKAQAFPYRDGLDVGPLLSWLNEHGFIQRYTVAGAAYIQVTKFASHQSPHVKEAPSKIPAPDSPGASTSPAPCSAPPIPALAALTPSSLTPDSGLRTADSSSLRSHSCVAPERDDPALTVFVHWQREWNHPTSKLDAKRRKRIESRLRDFTPAQLCDAISGFRHSLWHMGQDARGNGVVYDKLDTLLRDSAQVEEGLRLFAHPPRPPPKAETATERMLRTLNGSDDSRVIDHETERDLPTIARQ